ncbi:TFIIH complex kinase subunit CCL1 Ecym_7122 [Eremothecium cymbalariae DBVPG|uniref:Cyclin-like domain-containing protein n=1 Tax=Eremothecium cymbalariae (strain CBS 270.75 / DBVPG 7215 / KCTC 17166 / NRRL Y-17582) TaxID=931890 RepID=G8JVV7_ERECY|nr:hypothetical protein Ecym_7122 [Eremothecium cymbalariae DBVPG\
MENSPTPISISATRKTASNTFLPLNTKRVSDDDLYRTSTQYKLWSFTSKRLEQIRSDINLRSSEIIKKQIIQFKESHPNLSTEELEAIDSLAIPLNADEEFKLVNFYARKVQQCASSLNLPTEVTATAISFFRKFFLTNSVMDIHPKNILLTTIFLACKSENYFIGIESFAQKTKSKEDAILKYEFKVLESLKFTLLNHHPFKALHGFFLDIQSILNGKVDLEYMGQVYTNSKKKITDALLTDAVYQYTPPQITLAVLLAEDQTLIDRYLELKFPNKNKDNSVDVIKPTSADSTNTTSGSSSNGNMEVKEVVQSKEVPNEGNETTNDNTNMIDLPKLIKTIQDCRDIIFERQSVTKEEVKEIDAKLHYCKNPMLVLRRLKRQKDSSSSASPPDIKRQKL